MILKGGIEVGERGVLNRRKGIRFVVFGAQQEVPVAHID